MKKIGFLLMVCACILTPSAARADDGGFWDMIWHWDLKLTGPGTDFHLYCRDDSGKKVKRCEERFENIKNVFRPSASTHESVDFDKIKHEVNFRVSYLFSYGKRVGDEHLAPGEQPNDDKVHGLKLMGFYYYRVNGRLDVGAGAGTIPLFGLEGPRIWRPITTASAVVGLGGIWFMRIEESYLGNSIPGSAFGYPTSTYTSEAKPNFSVTFGFDTRRKGTYNVARPQ